jgi:adenylate cyclase
LGAYDYTMQAMPHVWALEKERAAEALGLLEQALAIDADYPLALSLAGWCHAQRSVYNWVDDLAGSQAKARALAERAAELSGDDPIILAVLGTIHTFVRNYGTARILLERAVTLDPNAAWAWHRLGWVENYSDRPHEGIAHFERALRLSPLDPMNFNNTTGFGSACELLGQYDKAAAMYQRARCRAPGGSRTARPRSPRCCAAIPTSRSPSSGAPWCFPRRPLPRWRKICAGLACRSSYLIKPTRFKSSRFSVTSASSRFAKAAALA